MPEQGSRPRLQIAILTSTKFDWFENNSTMIEIRTHQLDIKLEANDIVPHDPTKYLENILRPSANGK